MIGPFIMHAVCSFPNTLQLATGKEYILHEQFCKHDTFH